MNRNQAKNPLKQIFNLNHFYCDQWATIERLLNGGRVLLIEKTGFGKSLCYQFPATQFSGLTIVFSPLIALMRDQVKSLKSIGIPSACVNSEQEFRKNSEILEKARQGKIKILYIDTVQLSQLLSKMDFIVSEKIKNKISFRLKNEEQSQGSLFE